MQATTQIDLKGLRLSTKISLERLHVVRFHLRNSLQMRKIYRWRTN